MAIEIYVASISNGCAIAAVDGSALAKEIDDAAAVEGSLTSVGDLDRFLRERVYKDDIMLYGLGVYSREADAT